MDNISFGNLTTDYTQISPELQKRTESQENFTAIDTEKLKQDTVEIGKKVADGTKDNVFLRGLNFVGIKDWKKFLKTLGFTILTCVGFAVAGNKLTKPAAKLGDMIDGLLQKGFVGNIRNSIGGFLKNHTSGIKKSVSKLKIAQDIQETFKKNPAGPKWNIFRGFDKGAKGVFSNTLLEEISTFMQKTDGSDIEKQDKLLDMFKKMLGKLDKKEEVAKELVEGFTGSSNIDKVKLCDELIEGVIAGNKHLGKTATEIFSNLQNDKDLAALTNITMDQGGLFGAWWPVNILNKIYNKITGKELKGAFKGNFFDSMMKYSAVRGKSAKTLPAKLIQIIPPLVGDQVSNFVNDKSGFGVFLTYSLFSQVQSIMDAPKEKRMTNALNEIATGSMGWMVSMPLTYAAIYKTANLRKLKGKGIVYSILRNIGRVMGVGLDRKTLLGGPVGIAGGVMRFMLAMFIISPFIGKQISKICAKIFGKPYNKEEAEKERQIEEQKKQIVPELGITQGELIEKIEKNPQAIQKLQTDEKLAYTISQNPKALLDLLDNKEVQYIEPPKSPASQGIILSPANKGRLNNKTNMNTNSMAKNKTQNNSANNSVSEQKNVDSATYIPSSEFVAPKNTLSPEQQSEYDAVMSKADKYLKAAEKYI